MPIIADSLPDFSGKIVEGGRMLLMSVLGSGAYGKVYLAFDRKPVEGQAAYYAVKCMQQSKQGSRRDNLHQREFSLHEYVSEHPNIVTFHRMFKEKRFVFVVLDLCQGGDLFSAIAEDMLFQNRSDFVKSIFLQLLDAVAFCHDSGVYHRDLKPENVLLSSDKQTLYLADFGLATEIEWTEDYGCGSTHYMSPECIAKDDRGEEYSGAQNDVWSLGVILINLLTGRNPWRCAHTSDQGFQHFCENPNYFLNVFPISTRTNEILKRMLCHDPAGRSTVLEIRADVLRVETFFVNEDELEEAPSQASTQIKTSTIPSILSDTEAKSTIANIQVQNVHAYAHTAAVSATEAFRSNLSALKDIDSHSLNLVSAEPVPTSRSPTSSSSDISELVTPETIPRDPAVAVPDFPEGESLGLGQGMQLAVNAHMSPEYGKRQPHYVALRDVRAGMLEDDMNVGQEKGLVKRVVRRFQNVIAGSRSTYAI